MHVDVAIFLTDRSIGPGEVAREAEARGFTRLFVPEHTHIPVDHTPYPGGGALPEMYRRTLDPFVALGHAAAATSRLEIGTGMCLLAQRDPLVVAKATASLDHLSGGRFLFGVGYGWNRPEMAHHGVDPDRRREILREKVLAVRALWEEDEASFDGRHVRFAGSWSWPKPARDHVPVLLGAGAGPTTFRHVAEFADAWAPIPGRGGPLEETIPAMRRVVEERGRDPDAVEVIAFGAEPDPGTLESYAALGVTRAVVWLPSADHDRVVEALDGLGEVRERLGVGTGRSGAAARDRS